MTSTVHAFDLTPRTFYTVEVQGNTVKRTSDPGVALDVFLRRCGRDTCVTWYGNGECTTERQMIASQTSGKHWANIALLDALNLPTVLWMQTSLPGFD